MSAVILYEQARAAIERCSRIDEAKDIVDKSAALKAYARQRHDPEMEAWVAEVRQRELEQAA